MRGTAASSESKLSAAAAIGGAAPSGNQRQHQQATAVERECTGATERVAPSLADAATNLLASASASTESSFEQRLKDAVNKKRAAREQRKHNLRHHRQAEYQIAAAAANCSPMLAIKRLDGTSTESISTSNTRGKIINQQSSPSPSSTLKTLKCLPSHPIFYRLQSTSSLETRSEQDQEQQLHQHQQEESNKKLQGVVESDVASSSGLCTERQTNSGQVAEASASASAGAKLRERPRQYSQSARHKRRTTRKINRLFRQSFVGVAMLPQPASARLPMRRSSAVGRRATQSVYVKSPTTSAIAGSAAQPHSQIARRALRATRSNTLRISVADSGGAGGGVGVNYARNIAFASPHQRVGHQMDQRQLVRQKAAERRRGRLTTIGEDIEELERMEYARDVDSGYAWIILFVVFIINASTFGTARAYGLIFEKLARDDDRSRTDAAMPFTIMGAVENMAGPLSGLLLALTKSWRITVFSGSCLITLAHLLAGLWAGSQLGQLLAMGLMCGLGLSFVSISFFQVNNAYFVRYRNTAFGVGMTGAAFGTLIISPLCQYFLDNYEGTQMCYLMLGLIIAPNIPLALLLKPKKQTDARSSLSSMASSTSVSSTSSSSSSSSSTSLASPCEEEELASFEGHSTSAHALDTREIKSISGQLSGKESLSGQCEDGQKRQQSKRQRRRHSIDQFDIWTSIKMVIANPLFHLIWPTQLLFCWFNFVFGMIIVDFSKDRGMSADDVARLVPCWAFGQLVGRLVLSSLVDLKFLTYKSFTVICFFAIGLTTLLLNNTTLNNDDDDNSDGAAAYTYAQLINIIKLQPDVAQRYHVMLILIFILSMFIALLYILLNGLVVNYVEPSLQPLSIGISSFTGSFFLLPRANIIGYYRDTTGNYDAMLKLFTYVSLGAAIVWLILPPLCRYLKDLLGRRFERSRPATLDKNQESMRPYFTWLTSQQQQNQIQEQQHSVAA